MPIILLLNTQNSCCVVEPLTPIRYISDCDFHSLTNFTATFRKMTKDQLTAINDVVHKLQLAMLDSITDQKQLFAAGTLISPSDYEDVITEQTIAKLCYPPCGASLPSEASRRGKYRISISEHRVYDLHETAKFCSTGVLLVAERSRRLCKRLVRTSLIW